MTEAEKLNMVKSISGETDNDTLTTYLAIAANKVCRKAYPYDDTITVVPDKYAYTQIEIAVYLLNKRGAEGQTTHSENGISRGYEDGDVPPTLLRDIVPCAGVVS